MKPHMINILNVTKPFSFIKVLLKYYTNLLFLMSVQFLTCVRPHEQNAISGIYLRIYYRGQCVLLRCFGCLETQLTELESGHQQTYCK